MDPTLTSSTSDKRKALSLVAPPAAKKKRTTKKIPIEVISLLLEHKIILPMINVILCNFRPEPSNHQQLQNLPMLHLLVWPLSLYPFFKRPSFTLAFTLHLPFAEETFVNQPVEISSPEHASNPNSPRVQTSSPEAKTSASPRIQSPPSRVEAPVSSGTNPSSPQPEASNPPGTPPASLQMITQEIRLEPEQTSPPIQETRN
jgi:hypothetical protein